MSSRAQILEALKTPIITAGLKKERAGKTGDWVAITPSESYILANQAKTPLHDEKPSLFRRFFIWMEPAFVLSYIASVPGALVGGVDDYTLDVLQGTNRMQDLAKTSMALHLFGLRPRTPCAGLPAAAPNRPSLSLVSRVKEIVRSKDEIKL